MRTFQFNMRMTVEEDERLRALAKHHGLDPTALIRFLLKKEERCLDVPGTDHPKKDAETRSRR